MAVDVDFEITLIVAEISEPLVRKMLVRKMLEEVYKTVAARWNAQPEANERIVTMKYVVYTFNEVRIESSLYHVQPVTGWTKTGSVLGVYQFFDDLGKLLSELCASGCTDVKLWSVATTV